MQDDVSGWLPINKPRDTGSKSVACQVFEWSLFIVISAGNLRVY